MTVSLIPPTELAKLTARIHELEAARPHIEAELRQKIAAEIRDNPRVYDAPFTSNPADWIDAFDRGIDYAARIAEGKQ